MRDLCEKHLKGVLYVEIIEPNVFHKDLAACTRMRLQPRIPIFFSGIQASLTKIFVSMSERVQKLFKGRTASGTFPKISFCRKSIVS